MVPPSRVISRPPARKRKSALDPTRVMVGSGNATSPRIAPGFESRFAADHIAEGGWPGLHFKQERYQVYRPGDLGFLKGFRLQCSRMRYP